MDSHREISRVTTSAQLHMVALGQQSRAMCHDEPKLAPASTEVRGFMCSTQQPQLIAAHSHYDNRGS